METDIVQYPYASVGGRRISFNIHTHPSDGTSIQSKDCASVGGNFDTVERLRLRRRELRYSRKTAPPSERASIQSKDCASVGWSRISFGKTVLSQIKRRKTIRTETASVRRYSLCKCKRRSYFHSSACVMLEFWSITD
jgi:hypothetical protein